MMLSTLLLITLPASAQDSPTRQCADAATDAEVEVCLQLAAEHPDDIEGIAAALRAHIARWGSADRDLLLALLGLVDDTTAPAAAERIAALGDSRAVPALTACVERRAEPVANGCLRSLGPFPEGLSVLSDWLVDPELATPLRVAAAETLAALGTTEAGDALVDALRRPGLPAGLRRAIIAEVYSHFPERTDELDGQVASDGRLWLAIGGGAGLGYAMATAGHFGQSNLTGLGAITGAVGGATAGTLYGRAWPMEAGDAAYIATSGMLGTTSGLLIGGADPDDGDQVYLVGLGGMVLGYGTSIATRGLHPGTALDSIEATGVALASAVAADGVAAQLRVGRTEPIPGALNLATGLGLATGTIGGHLAAPQVDMSGPDVGLVALTSAYGLGFGALVPIGEHPRPGLPLVGLGVGALTGYALSHPLEVGGDVQAAAWAGAAYGGAFGLGVGLLIDPYDPQVTSGAALVAGTAGLGLAAALAQLDTDPFDDRDVVLTGLVTGWATWQSVGIAVAIDADNQTTGWFILAPPAAGATIAALSPEIDIPVPHAAAATSLGLWGAYTGGVAADLAKRDQLAWSLVGSDIGLASGALLLSPLVGAPPLVIGLADAGGVLVGSSSALVASLASDDRQTILAASLAGAGVGLAGGAAVGAAWKRGGTRDMARAELPRIGGTWTLAPLALPVDGVPHYGARIGVEAW